MKMAKFGSAINGPIDLAGFKAAAVHVANASVIWM
jgi:hypothetical protein